MGEAAGSESCCSPSRVAAERRPSARAEDCVADFGGVVDGSVVHLLPRRSRSTATARSEISRIQPADSNISFYTPGNPNSSMAGHLRQRRAYGQHVLQRIPSGEHALVHQRLDRASSRELPEPPDPCRENQQAESAGPDHGHHRRPLHLQAGRSRSCSTRHRAPSSTPAGRQTICTASRSGTTSTPPACTLSYVSHAAYWLETARSGAAYVFRTSPACSPSTTSPSSRPGEQFVIEITVVLNDTPANVPGRSSSTRPSGTSDGSSTASSTSRCRASGASRHR